MGHAAADELLARGVSETLILSRNPDQTIHNFGAPAVATLQFPWPPIDRERYLGEIIRVLAGERDALPDHDQIFAFIDAIRDCDAVLIAGGGNMNSSYGWLLYERAALALVAGALHKPLVISGQTLGPTLIEADRAVLSSMLNSASLVGLREATSYALARELVPDQEKVVHTLDDASFLAPSASATAPDAPYIAVSFSTNTGDVQAELFYETLANALDELVDHTGWHVLFIPHMGVDLEADQDLAAHENIASRLRTRNVFTCGMRPAREVAGLTSGAQMVLTSRYHPAVFAAAAGVPVVALAVDDYSDSRITGALDNWGLGAFSLPLPLLESGHFAAAVREAMHQRDTIVAGLTALRTVRGDEAGLWWDGVVAALGDQKAPPPSSLTTAKSIVPAESTPWIRDALAIRRVLGPRTRQGAACSIELEREQQLRVRAEAESRKLDTELNRLNASRLQRSVSYLRRIAPKSSARRNHEL